MSDIDRLATQKQLALFLVGSSQAYENYKRTQDLQSVYPNDFDYYNDTFYYRHDRNIEEIKKIKTLLAKGVLKPEMLLYNTWNAFYPSYVLGHHFGVFLNVLQLFGKSSELQGIISKAKSLQTIGMFAKRVINTDFGRLVDSYQPTLTENGQIEMSEAYYFYDKHVALYYHVACFLTAMGSDTVLVFVSLRDAKGELRNEITVKDFGATISPQYLQIGYNFNKVKPFLTIKVNDMVAKIQGINNLSYFNEFNLSLLDLKKSLYLAIRYTLMRKQFKTLPQSSQQRPILTYQAVGSRVIDGYARLVLFSELNKALLNNRQIIPFAAPLLDINHHLILESVIKLRECCGGFGYLQVAGHGGSIERLSLRASDCFVADVPENAQILKRLHYYSSSDDMEEYFGESLTKGNAFRQSQVFSVFVNVCVNMRKNSSSLRKEIYLRHFMYQSSIQLLKTTEQFSKLPKDSLIFLVLFYSCASYILQHPEYINWKFIESHLTREEYFRGLTEVKNNYLNQLIKRIGEIESVLQVKSVRNVIVGREDADGFYNEVLLQSKKNLRNSDEFVDYVRRPIVQWLAENNQAKI